jgi:hypothetical protein
VPEGRRAPLRRGGEIVGELARRSRPCHESRARRALRACPTSS